MLIDSLAQTFNISKENIEQYREKVVNFDRIVMNEIAFTLAQSRALGTFLNCEECDEILKWIALNNYEQWNALIDAQVVPEEIKEYLRLEVKTDEKPAEDAPAEVESEEPQMRNAIKFEKLIKDPQTQKKDDEDKEQKAS